MSARIVGAAVLGCLALAALTFVRAPDREGGVPGPGARSPRPGPREAVPAPPSSAADRTDPERRDGPGSRPWPRSLRGTTPSGGLRTDAAGHFAPGPEALLFFDYFLSASNEETPDELAERIREAIRLRLTPPADAEAETFLAVYLEYLEAGAAEFSAPGLAESGDLERRLQWIRELRRERFGPALAQRLFGDEEERVLIHLERRRLRSAEDLEPGERRARLEALEQRYPEPVREARRRAVLPLRHAREEAALRDRGASADEIDALRTERFGPEAARRMRALDEERADWQARWETYSARRRALAEEIDDAEALAAAVAALRAEHFDLHEMRRVEILDRSAR